MGAKIKGIKYQGHKIATRDQHVFIQYQASNNDTSLYTP